MKIKEIIQMLNEGAKMHLPIKDAPDWVKEILKKKGTGWNLTSIEVEATNKVNIFHYVDYDVMTVYFYNNGKVIENTASSEETYAVASKAERALDTGVVVELSDDVSMRKPSMVLITHTHPKHSAELFAHPNQMPKQIENKNNNLSDDEIKVLLITKGYVSSYRNDYFKRYNVFKNLEEIKNGLIKKGLMTSAGALNLAGKNEVEKIRDANGGTSALEKLFGYGR